MNTKLVLYALLSGLMIVAWTSSCVIYRMAAMNERLGPIEAKEFSRLTVVTVGTGGSFENRERLGPCTALGLGKRVILVDAGRGVAEALRHARIPVSQPDTVLLTNLLGENAVGLDDLLITGWLGDRSEPLRVVGPLGTAALVRGIEQSLGAALAAGRDGLGLPAEGARVDVLEVEDGWVEEWDGLRIRAAALSGGPLPALAWSFESAGDSVVVSGTGWDEEALVRFAQGADMLVHEGVYIPDAEEIEAAELIHNPDRLAREAAIHTSLRSVGSLAQRAGVKTLVLVRLRPPPLFDLQVTQIVGESFGGSIAVPDDGDELIP